MLRWPQSEERRPQERSGGEVEWSLGLLGGQPSRFGLTLGRRQVGKVDNGQTQLELTGDVLHGLAVVGRERCTQHLVPTDDLVERALECGHVDRRFDQDREVDVVIGVPGCALVEEPQPLFGERERVCTRSIGLRVEKLDEQDALLLERPVGSACQRASPPSGNSSRSSTSISASDNLSTAPMAPRATGTIGAAG